MTTGSSHLDHAVQTATVWLGELMAILDWNDRDRAYRALHTVLPALRDHLPAGQAAHLAAQLPLIIRGLFFESWKPDAEPLADRGGDAFIAHIAQAFSQNGDAHPSEIASAVFALLERHISAGEIQKVKQTLPEGVRRYWPPKPLPRATRESFLYFRHL